MALGTFAKVKGMHDDKQSKVSVESLARDSMTEDNKGQRVAVQA